MEKISPNQNPPSVYKIEDNPKGQIKISTFLIMVAVSVVLGILVGFIPTLGKKSEKSATASKSIGKAVGIVDKKTFKDSAEGVLKEGGIDGEGNFHIERVGGESQNVYLTSTTVDLSEYINKKVRVWGQTFSGEKAGWLMDVGLVETLK